MSQKKPLYVAKTFNALQDMGEIKFSKNQKGSNLLNSMAKIFKEAEEKNLEGDEEKAYVYYMRFFNLLEFMKKTPQFKNQRDQITTLLGGPKGLERTLDTLEVIAENLRQRYLKAYPELNKEFMKDLEAADAISDSRSPSPEKIKIQLTVSPKQFYEHIKDCGFSLLVIDCRPSRDFAASRIKYDPVLNVPEEILVKGVTVGKIAGHLQDEERIKWSQRLYKSHIILLDQSSCEFVTESPVWVMNDLLQNWDMDFNKKAPIQLLSGGFESFQLYYPMETTDPRYKPPQNLYVDDGFDDIQYPDSIFNTTFSPRSTSMVHGRPVINRDSKAVALETYAEKEKYLKNLLERRKKNLNESVEIEKLRVDAEADWKAISEKESKPNEPNRSQEVYHKILELESRARDIQIEDESLKENEQTFLEMLPEEEAAKLQEEAHRQEEEAKEKERKKLEYEAAQKRLAEERERKLKESRVERKYAPKPVPPPQPKQQPVRPKQPHIPDRSAKPHFEPVYIPEIKRDFSPVRGGMGRGLTGLKNLGNTCYMNSIIQCLSNTQALYEYFNDGMYIKHRNGQSLTKCRIAEEVAAVIKALWEGHRMISSKDLKAIVGQYERSFKGHEQQDSHEFLTILMDWLHSDLQAIFSVVPENNLSPSDKAWYEFTKHRESIILRLFYGQIKSTVQCSRCHEESTTYDTFSNLSLELPQNANRTDLHKCLDMYFEGEQVSGWMCPNCKDTRDAVKKLDISRLPAVLVIHLKRFNVNHDHGGYSKKQNYVEFPLKNLDMRHYLPRSEMINNVNKKTSYNLYAVSNHYGTMETGHYTAYCKSPAFDKWYKFNDQQVSPLEPRDVNSSAAYILFYEMSNPVR